MDRFVSKKKRIAIILPIAYRGGTLRAAQLVAEALHIGSHHDGVPVEIVFVHPDDPDAYPDSEFAALPGSIKRRVFTWKILDRGEAYRAMRYAGFDSWEPSSECYIVPDDGIRQLQDCDLWIFISDRLSAPLLPIKPYAVFVYDYLQRYEKIMDVGIDQPFLDMARGALRVFVTTEFTKTDALQYAGISPTFVRRLPMLAPLFVSSTTKVPDEWHRPYFLWPTNTAPHKNHLNAMLALRAYYEELGGELDCWVTGVGTSEMLKVEVPHLARVRKVFLQSALLEKNVHFKGDLPDSKYQTTLAGAKFIWHAGRIDNGTFCVVQAATLGIPALSSQYPAMVEIDRQFSLNMRWMDSQDPYDMAQQLKWMEAAAESRRNLLPPASALQSQSVTSLANIYWSEVSQCL